MSIRFVKTAIGIFWNQSAIHIIKHKILLRFDFESFSKSNSSVLSKKMCWWEKTPHHLNKFKENVKLKTAITSQQFGKTTKTALVVSWVWTIVARIKGLKLSSLAIFELFMFTKLAIFSASLTQASSCKADGYL